MKAICFESIQRIDVREIQDATVQDPCDAIIEVDVAGLCGSDLHPFFGREVGIEPGTVMGHEFVGTVVAIGSAVEQIRISERVCAPFTTNCGKCQPCRNGLTSRCVHGQLFGWRENANGLHGGQSQFVRVPLADSTLMKVPEGVSNEMALLLGDNLSTAHFCADMAEIREDGVYVVVGCGTVGLLTIATAIQRGARSVIAVDPVADRLRFAKSLGAIPCGTSSTQSDGDGLGHSDSSLADLVAEHSDGQGADAVMELVGLPEAQRMAIDAVRPGGTLAVIGCHCSPHFAFSPSEAYDKNLTYRTGRCPARHYMDILAAKLAKEPMDLSWAITHRFSVEDAHQAYDTFAFRKNGCRKAVINFR